MWLRIPGQLFAALLVRVLPAVMLAQHLLPEDEGMLASSAADTSMLSATDSELAMGREVGGGNPSSSGESGGR